MTLKNKETKIKTDTKSQSRKNIKHSRKGQKHHNVNISYHSISTK